MSKKQKREQEQKAALRQRLTDLASGAYGGYSPLDWDNEEQFGGMAGEMGLDAFGRWIGAIGNSLLDEKRQYLIKPNCLEHFDYLSKATEWLWESGVRA